MHWAILHLMAEEYSGVYVNDTVFTRASVEGHLGCLHVLASVNNAAMDRGVHMFLQMHVFEFFG